MRLSELRTCWERYSFLSYPVQLYKHFDVCWAWLLQGRLVRHLDDGTICVTLCGRTEKKTRPDTALINDVTFWTPLYFRMQSHCLTLKQLALRMSGPNAEHGTQHRSGGCFLVSAGACQRCMHQTMCLGCSLHQHTGGDENMQTDVCALCSMLRNTYQLHGRCVNRCIINDKRIVCYLLSGVLPL